MSSTGRAVLRFRSLITPLTATVVTLALFTALLGSTRGGSAAGSTLDVTLSSHDLGAHSDVSLVVSIPASTPFPDFLEIRFPSGWQFDDWGSSGPSFPGPGEGDLIAVGQTLESSFGTIPVSIRSFGTNLGTANWLIESSLCCTSTTLSGSVLDGHSFVLDTSLPFSTPFVLELTFFGALGDGTSLLTNPVSPGIYEFSSTQFDFLGQPTVVTDVVQVGSPVGGIVELGVGSGDSPVEHESDGGHEREIAALAVALAAVAGVSWHRYRRRAG